MKVKEKVMTNLLDSPAVDELNVKTLTSVPMLLRTLLPLAEQSFSNLDAGRNYITTLSASKVRGKLLGILVSSLS